MLMLLNSPQLLSALTEILRTFGEKTVRLAAELRNCVKVEVAVLGSRP